MSYNITIDGPAGAGKSTIAKQVAKEKGFLYVDTGAMYRALAIYFMKLGLQANEREKIIAAAGTAHVSLVYEDGVQQVYLEQENVTAKLRDEAVGKMAAETAQIAQVRDALLVLQRDLAKNNDVVMDGRDIGTRILPDADLKIYLTASVETRALRRFKELSNQGLSCNLEEIKADIIARDYIDMNRDVAPLKKAADAIEIDSSNLSISEVVSKILRSVK